MKGHLQMEIRAKDKLAAKKAIKKFSVKKNREDIFYDLCFAILAPQTTFKNNTKVIRELRGEDFYRKDISVYLLQAIVRPTRFFRQKADRLLKAKMQYENILSVLFSNERPIEKRAKLVKMVNGLGMKAASHLLRNLGCADLAIIDTHVIKYLGCEPPKNTKDYLRIEEEFVRLAGKENITPAELDAIVWKKYSNTEWDKFVY